MAFPGYPVGLRGRRGASCHVYRPGPGGGGEGGSRKAVSPRPSSCFLPLAEAFSVDMDSGLVTTQRPLQSYERFNLTVVATDGGEPPLWGTTMLLVEVIDVNDNRPVFVRPPNGTVLHIREVSLTPGPLPSSIRFPLSACWLILHSLPHRVKGPHREIVETRVRQGRADWPSATQKRP